MKAWRIHEAGGPEALVLEDVPRPEPRAGELLIRVKAFGLNRSEYFTRIGESPGVRFPRVLGIECAGVVEAAPGGEVQPGQRVLAMMGGMGRDFDGSYAEFTCVPVRSVFPVSSSLDWAALGALPELLQTTLGSLRVGLGAQQGQTLLIRGGTSSIGLMTASLAKGLGLRVLATTRSPAREALLRANGVDEVFVDEGAALAKAVRAVHPEGVDCVLELIGATTLLDSLQCTRVGGVVCMTGILGGAWELPAFRPMEQLPSGVRLTAYSGGAADITAGELQRFVAQVEAGAVQVPRGPTWRFQQVVEAHRAMDANSAGGKMVVVVDG